MGKKRLRTRIINVHTDTMIRFAANQFSPSTVCIMHLLDASGQTTKVLSEADIMDAFFEIWL